MLAAPGVQRLNAIAKKWPEQAVALRELIAKALEQDKR